MVGVPRAFGSVPVKIVVSARMLAQAGIRPADFLNGATTLPLGILNQLTRNRVWCPGNFFERSEHTQPPGLIRHAHANPNHNPNSREGVSQPPLYAPPVPRGLQSSELRLAPDWRFPGGRLPLKEERTDRGNAIKRRRTGSPSRFPDER